MTGGDTEQGAGGDTEVAGGRRLADVAETEAALSQAGIVPISPTSGPMLGDTLLTLYLPNFNFGSGTYLLT